MRTGAGILLSGMTPNVSGVFTTTLCATTMSRPAVSPSRTRPQKWATDGALTRPQVQSIATALALPARRKTEVLLSDIKEQLNTTDDARLAVRAAFKMIDKNNDGTLSRIEVIKALRTQEKVSELLKLPHVIRQEDGTRDNFEVVFQAIDRDDSKSISMSEFEDYFIPPEAATPAPQKAGRGLLIMASLACALGISLAIANAAGVPQS